MTFILNQYYYYVTANNNYLPLIVLIKRKLFILLIIISALGNVLLFTPAPFFFPKAKVIYFWKSYCTIKLYKLQTRTKWRHKQFFFNCRRSRLCGMSIFHAQLVHMKAIIYKMLSWWHHFCVFYKTESIFRFLVCKTYCYDWITSKLLQMQHVINLHSSSKSSVKYSSQQFLWACPYF